MTPDGNLTPALNPDATADAVLVEHGAEPAPTAKNQAGRAIREVVETLLLAALIFFLVRLVVLNFRVDGESMLPNLDDGQMLLVNRNAYEFVDIGDNRYYPFDPPERGDVIVFVDGELLPEDYIKDRTTCRPARSDNCDVIVPEGYVYVLGDHRSNSSDSRVFGPVPVGNIVGKAWFSYWPADDVGFVPHRSYDDADQPAISASP